MSESHTQALFFVKERAMAQAYSHTIALAWLGFYWACKLCSLNGSMFGTHNDFQKGSVGKSIHVEQSHWRLRVWCVCFHQVLRLCLSRIRTSLYTICYNYLQSVKLSTCIYLVLPHTSSWFSRRNLADSAISDMSQNKPLLSCSKDLVIFVWFVTLLDKTTWCPLISSCDLMLLNCYT